ncbi:MAG: hypothetical protein Harvfovirus13_14 [Harvfovirus sp.]|uniref:Uncharacterized protein n=1 Tax=Harvfovirus sp. TaxID=2487768 RepID=A0A3G5A1B8_9VIRU|nr:MAG: hypothetical protein Harvfovirus13_14 [Harvfovirus sp.]
MFRSGSILKTSLDDEGRLMDQIRNVESKGAAGSTIFVDRFYPVPFARMSLHVSAKASLSIENAGGSSDFSEALSIDLMAARFGASKFALEMEVEYWISYKKCDFVTVIHNQNFGVSVTRAMGYPKATNFTEGHATKLLNSKINGLLAAREVVGEKHHFTKCILHVWCQTNEIASLICKAHQVMVLADSVISQVIVLVTVCIEKYIYTNTL